eukprot:3995539-Prymnesium_polylepis.1
MLRVRVSAFTRMLACVTGFGNSDGAVCVQSRAATGSAHAGRTGRVLARVLFRGRCAPRARDCARYCEALRHLSGFLVGLG